MAADLPAALTLARMAALIGDGAASAVELARACLDRIERLEPRLRAWAQLRPDLVLAQAHAADERRRAGRALSPLDGMPIGIKDNIDTADLPTEMGSPIHRGRCPVRDAAAVGRLRRLGMVILGKTVTTPFGMNVAAETRNPVDPTRTLGASSVGSAAAVAAGMVPITLNTQNTSSTTRPASYAGVFALKPSHGALPMEGALSLSPAVAHLALLASSLEDLALLSGHLLGSAGDAGAMARPRHLGIVRGPWWARAAGDAAAALMGLCERAGIVEEAALPHRFDHAIDAHLKVVAADVAVTLAGEYRDHRDALPCDAINWIETGRAMAATDYISAQRLQARLNHDLEETWSRFAALVTLSTPSAAPRLEDGIGDGTFSMPWTFCGLPTLSLPLLRDASGLPVGLQLIGRRGDEGRLLAIAAELLAVAAG